MHEKPKFRFNLLTLFACVFVVSLPAALLASLINGRHPVAVVTSMTVWLMGIAGVMVLTVVGEAGGGRIGALTGMAVATFIWLFVLYGVEFFEANYGNFRTDAISGDARAANGLYGVHLILAVITAGVIVSLVMHKPGEGEELCIEQSHRDRLSAAKRLALPKRAKADCPDSTATAEHSTAASSPSAPAGDQ